MSWSLHCCTIHQQYFQWVFLWLHDPESDPSCSVSSFSPLWQSQLVWVPPWRGRWHHFFDPIDRGMVAHGTGKRLRALAQSSWALRGHRNHGFWGLLLRWESASSCWPKWVRLPALACQPTWYRTLTWHDEPCHYQVDSSNLPGCGWDSLFWASLVSPIWGKGISKGLMMAGIRCF